MLVVMIFTLNTNAQYAHNETPFSASLNKGITALHQGDTLAAFQYIQSAYHFSPPQETISYYYTYLSLVLQKSNAENLALHFLNNYTTNSFPQVKNLYGNWWRGIRVNGVDGKFIYKIRACTCSKY